MRKPFIETITKLAESDNRIILLIGDVGFTYMEDFMKRFPNQFLNTGVCEQSMMGVAVGLSKSGWKPWVYSMINFVTFRPYEQVRNDICYQNANVKLLGVSGSVAYKFLGFSHNIEKDEDKKVLSGLPNMKFYIPKTEKAAVDTILKEYKRSGPAYIRL
jgi:transketolase